MKINHIKIQIPEGGISTNEGGNTISVTVRKQKETSYKGSECYDLIHIMHTLSKIGQSEYFALFDSDDVQLCDSNGIPLYTSK